MKIQAVLLLIDAILVNLAYLLSFLIKFGTTIPEPNFTPFKKTFVFLTAIHILSLALFNTYKARFKSSWDLFKGIFLGLALGTVLCIVFVYVFRIYWGAFPSSVFVLSFLY